ncbi:MAG: DUF3383 domain-containing protein, partial [Deltaproteobacteria bacterium]|nr:DUF3383 domain-containing protein [Deltaproteobacteria bacterium]
REYADLDEVAADYASTDDEYKAANAAFAQTPRVEKVKIGVRATPVAQIQTLDFDADFVTGNNIDLEINEVAITTVPFNGTHAQTLTDLAAEIQLNSDVSTATVTGARQITITAQKAGVPVALTNIAVTGGASQANGSTTTTTPNVGVTEDLNAIVLNDDEWYALVLTSRDADEVELAAAWIEAQAKIFFTASDDVNIKDALSTTDIAYILNSKNYDRTAVVFNEAPSDFIDAGWLGYGLSQDPGSITWKFKDIAGAVVSSLTATERTAVLNKKANLYTEIGGIDMMEEGTMAGGEFIDVIRGVDWLTARMQENVFGLLVNSKKIPYTNAGIAQVEGKVRTSLDNAIRQSVLRANVEKYNGLPYFLDVPTVNEIAANDRAQRLLPDIEWEADLAGAIHKVTIKGRVVV